MAIPAAASLEMAVADLDIRVSRKRFRAVLQVDGVIRQRLTFATCQQLTDWAYRVGQVAGDDLYIHLHPCRQNDLGLALRLARDFQQRGLMTGIIPDRAVCRSGDERLH